MPFRRKGGVTWYAQLRTETGRKQLSLGVPCTATARPLAVRIEAMWEELASEHREWALLGKVLSGEVSITTLYDHWKETKGSVSEVKRRLEAKDLDPMVREFLVVHRANAKADSTDHVAAHVRWLIPDSVPCPAPSITDELLTKRLYEYPGKRNTIRKVHSSWSVFFDYATKIRKAYAVSPMTAVPRPRVEKPPIQFYELETVEQIIAWQPTEQRRALFALFYGTPIEVSTALTITRADLNAATQEVRAPGTKARTRDRVLRIDDWAWPTFWAYARTLLPMARIFSGISRWTASDWHRQTVGVGVKDRHGRVAHAGLELAVRTKLHASRHAWAIRHLRAGTPVAVVQEAMGHATAKETLDTYGPWVPNGVDRAKWGAVVAEAERQRREAK